MDYKEVKEKKMTPEEAIKEFESELEWAELNMYPYISKQKVEADKMAIKALKQKQEPKTGHWISIKDKLPKEEYCLKDDEGGIYAFSKKVLVSIKANDEQFVTTGLYSRSLLDGKHIWKATDYFVNMNDYVVAWMPLPAPYEPQEESEGEKNDK